MDTVIIKAYDNDNIDSELEMAGNILKNGGIVAFPTETVYGLGGDALNPSSSKKIYEAKGRPSDNPLIVHIAEFDKIYAICKEVPESAIKLADKFWPGPLTMILKKSDEVPFETTGGLDTVAVRMPVHAVAQKFIAYAGGYVAAPSANISGRPSPTCAKYVIEDMNGRANAIIDGGDSDIGLESTIVDLTGEIPMLLRPGYITLEDLREVLGKVETDKTILGGNAVGRPKAPGMKYRHYAPKGDLTIVNGENEKVVAYINDELNKVLNEGGKKTGVITTDENAGRYISDSVKSLGKRNDEKSIARNLFRVLREFDDEGVDIIFTESFALEGISQATMNRLLKAAGHKEVNL